LVVLRHEKQSCGWCGSANVLVGIAGGAFEEDLSILFSIGRA
jgi:hypothetical protein